MWLGPSDQPFAYRRCLLVEVLLYSVIWLVITLYLIIKCPSNCARCDWSVWLHYSSIKHAVYVTRVLYRVIMHAAYVTSFSARNFFNINFHKRNKKLSPHALLSYISMREFLRTLEKCEKHSAAPRVSLCTSLVFLKIPVCLCNSTMHSGAFFIPLAKYIIYLYIPPGVLGVLLWQWSWSQQIICPAETQIVIYYSEISFLLANRQWGQQHVHWMQRAVSVSLRMCFCKFTNI